MSEIDQLDWNLDDEGSQKERKLIDEKKELQQLIFQLTEEKTERRKRISARENEKIELISGRKTSIRQFMDVVAQARQPYRSFFDQPYWNLVCKLNDWPLEWGKDYISRSQHKGFADFNNHVIYSRFRLGIVEYLQLKNPYIAQNIREFKLSQYLSDIGQEILINFIKEATEKMNECQTMHEFRLRMLKECGVSYQANLFN